MLTLTARDLFLQKLKNGKKLTINKLKSVTYKLFLVYRSDFWLHSNQGTRNKNKEYFWRNFFFKQIQM